MNQNLQPEARGIGAIQQKSDAAQALTSLG